MGRRVDVDVITSFTQEQLLAILDSIVPSQYDFFYMPVDYKTNCNLGFGYVSMITVRAVERVYTAVRANNYVYD